MSNFEQEFNVNSLISIKPMGHDFVMEVTPRYIHQYTAKCYEELTVSLMRSYLKQTDIFLDVGAHYGYYSLFAANANKEIKIIAIEPIEENFRVLNRNLIHNNISTERVKCINAAASSSTGKIHYYKSATADNSCVFPHPNSGTLEQIDVASVILDEILENESYKSLFIKTGTNGNVKEILKGLSSTFLTCDDITMLLEMKPEMLKLAGISCEEIVEYLRENNFSLYAIDDNEFRYYPLDAKENLEMMAVIYEKSYFNVLCVKRQKALSVVFFSHSAKLGGAERSLLDLLRGLSERKVLCTVVLPEEGPIIDALKDHGCAVYVVPKVKALKNSWWWCSLNANDDFKKKLVNTFDVALNLIAPELKKIAPDVIFSQTIVSPWGAVCANFMGIPHVLSVREYGALDHNLQFFLGFEESINALYESSDAVFCVTNDVSTTLFGMDKNKKTSVVYSDIRVDRASEIAIEKKSDGIFDIDWDAGITVGIFSTICKGKGQEDIIRACIELCKEGLNVKCIWAGTAEEEYLKHLDQLIEESGFLDRFSRYDFVDDPLRLMNEVDIVVSCARSEALGRTLIEAILLGKPIIYANTDGLKEIYTNGVHGLAYEVGDYKGLADKIWLTVSNKEETQKRISSAREYVNHKFNTENYTGKIEAKLRVLKENRYKEDRKNAVIGLINTLGMEDTLGIYLHPKLYFSENADGFNEKQTVLTEKIPLGLFSVDFELTDHGFKCLRFDPTEEHAIELKIYNIVITSDGGDIIVNPQMDIYSNGINKGRNSWDFLNFDPHVVMLLKCNAKSIKIAGEVRTRDNGDVIERLNNQLNQAMTDRNGQIAALNLAVIEREGQIAALNHTVTARDGQLASLDQAIVELESQVISLNKAVAMRDEQVTSLAGIITEQNNLISNIKSSRSWKFTWPLRVAARVIHGQWSTAFTPISKELSAKTTEADSTLNSHGPDSDNVCNKHKGIRPHSAADKNHIDE